MTRAAKFLRAKRLELGFSQVEVGVYLGYTSQFIANWESGKSRPPRKVLGKLCEKYKITKKELVNRITRDVADELMLED